MKQIIIDTDPGVDDAIAIAFAVAAKLPVIGVTTVYGNSSIKNCTTNALSILQIMGSDIPVYRGAGAPISGTAVLPQSHGDNGLGGFILPKLNSQPQKQTAVDFIIQTLETSTETTIICMGPATNMALVASLRPDLIENIEELVMLGGVFFEKGNMTPVAEFNALNDPYALKKCVSLNCLKAIIPIDVCRKVIFTRKDFDRITNKKLRNTFRKITDLFIQYYTSDDEYAGFSGAVMYDLLTTAYLLDRNLFTFEDKDVDVEISSPLTFAQTIMKKSKSNPCSIAVTVQADKIKDTFFETINSL